MREGALRPGRRHRPCRTARVAQKHGAGAAAGAEQEAVVAGSAGEVQRTRVGRAAAGAEARVLDPQGEDPNAPIAPDAALKVNETHTGFVTPK